MSTPSKVPQELVNAFLDGDLSESQGRDLTAWLKADPENVRFFVRETHAHHALHEIITANAQQRQAARRGSEVIVTAQDESGRGSAVKSTAPRPKPARVLRNTPAQRGGRSRPWAPWIGVAAAAAVVLAVGAFWFLQPRYPAPVADGAFVLDSGDVIERGSVVTARTGGASLELGGYCQIKAAAGSQVRVEGSEKNEAVKLLSGEVACTVDRQVGTFKVNSEVGSVSVTGTSFTVKLIPKQGVETMRGKAMAFMLAVAVTTGSVTVQYDGETHALRAGESKVYGADNAPGMFAPPPPQQPPQQGAPNVRPGGRPAQMPPPTPPDANNGNNNQLPGAAPRPPMPPPAQGDPNGGPIGAPPSPGDQPGTQPGQPGGDNRPKGPPPPLLAVLDTNKDGEISAEEIANAVESLKKLDRNHDGKIDGFELRPPPPPGDGTQGQPGTSGDPSAPNTPAGTAGPTGQATPGTGAPAKPPVFNGGNNGNGNPAPKAPPQGGRGQGQPGMGVQPGMLPPPGGNGNNANPPLGGGR